MLNLIDIVLADKSIEPGEHLGLHQARKILDLTRDETAVLHDMAYTVQNYPESETVKRPIRLVEQYRRITPRLPCPRAHLPAVPRLLILLIIGGLVASIAEAQDTAAVERGPFFVYMGSFSTKGPAQNHAAQFGGWVLRTDLYDGLTPGFYAAVIGPFRERVDARRSAARAAAHPT